MPEYLVPGVYLEETSSRAKPIEGVPTNTAGMAGRTEYGPVPYKLTTPDVTTAPKPTLMTSFTEYVRLYGGLGEPGRPILLAHAARSFFDNGGRRLYVSRVFHFAPEQGGSVDVQKNFASLDVGHPAVATWRARWPGQAGNKISLKVEFVRSENVWVGDPVKTLKGVLPGAAVEIGNDTAEPPVDDTAPVQANIRIVDELPDGSLGFRKATGIGADPVPSATAAAFHITLNVTVRFGDHRTDVYSGLELETPHSLAVANVLQAVDPSDEGAVVWLDWKDNSTPTDSQALLEGLLAQDTFGFLSGTDPDEDLTANDLTGRDADPDDATQAATGLAALGERDDIAIVACPDTVTLDVANGQPQAVSNLLAHCERFKYRIAIVDPPRDSSISQVRKFRSKFDSPYGALYFPWVRILDPNDSGAPPATIDLPPSGFVAGIYARSDIEHGVHKAPANEVVRGGTKLVYNVTSGEQSVLNAEGINALRSFEGRGNLVWGARTMSSNPEWKYVNVRRLLIYLEHSTEKSTQWAVFDPNDERLWVAIRQTIEKFLLMVWRTGALTGTKPEEAFFARCDRSTMTQNDLDNGRLICLIGVAPTRPAEFVTFQIGQWTADAKQS